MSRLHSGAGMVMLAAALWGTTGTAQAFAPSGATPPVVGTMRLVLGGAVLLLLALAQGQLRWSRAWLSWALLVASLGTAAYQLAFFGGVARTGVAVGTIVGIGSAPIMGGLLGHLVHGEPLHSRWFLATALAILGCALLTLSGGEVQVDLGGILLALGAGLAYAIYTTASKSLLQQQPPEAVMAVIFCLGALLLLPLLALYPTAWMLKARGLLVLLHLGLIATGLSYVFFGRGLQTVPVSTAVTLTLAEPLTAGLLGILVLGEGLTPLGALGIAALFTGLLLITRQNRVQ